MNYRLFSLLALPAHGLKLQKNTVGQLPAVTPNLYMPCPQSKEQSDMMGLSVREDIMGVQLQTTQCKMDAADKIDAPPSLAPEDIPMGMDQFSMVPRLMNGVSLDGMCYQSTNVDFLWNCITKAHYAYRNMLTPGHPEQGWVGIRRGGCCVHMGYTDCLVDPGIPGVIVCFSPKKGASWKNLFLSSACYREIFTGYQKKNDPADKCLQDPHSDFQNTEAKGGFPVVLPPAGGPTIPA